MNRRATRSPFVKTWLHWPSSCAKHATKRADPDASALVEQADGLLYQRPGLLHLGLIRRQILIGEGLVGLGEQRLGLIQQLGRRLVGSRRCDGASTAVVAVVRSCVPVDHVADVGTEAGEQLGQRAAQRVAERGMIVLRD